VLKISFIADDEFYSLLEPGVTFIAGKARFSYCESLCTRGSTANFQSASIDYEIIQGVQNFETAISDPHQKLIATRVLTSNTVSDIATPSRHSKRDTGIGVI